MSEPYVEIDLAALRWNWAQARALASPGCRLLPVVKADAYGHGMAAVARELEGAGGAWGLAVSGLEEALELRGAAGILLPVLLLLGVRPEEAAEAVRAKLTPVLFDLGEAEALNRAAAAQGVRQPVHVKIDTGMGRLGFSPRDLTGALPRLAALKNLEVEGVCSHLATADADETFSLEQLSRFQTALSAFRRAGLSPALNHLANSAALMGIQGIHLNLCRPGIMLYGGYPSEALRRRVSLRPVMRVAARVLQVKEMGCGESVSYGRTYTCPGRERVAVIGCGYAHGYSRALSNKASVLIRGQRAPVRGRVCMNAFMVDVSAVPEAQPGDEAVLLGAQGGETVSAEELAEMSGTISYELFCALGRLCRRRLAGQEAARAEVSAAAAPQGV